MTKTTRTLADLQSAFKTPERNFRPSNYYPFHLMPYDAQAIIRFLPDKNLENPMGFLVEKVVHNLVINGNKRTVPCRSMYGEECPICAVSQQFYKAGDETNGKKYWKKRQHLGQILVMEDPLPPDATTGEKHEGHVRYINLGFQLFGIIKSIFESGDLDEIPFALQGGYNFIINKRKQGEYPNYTMGSQFARRQSDLTPDQIALVEDQMIDLSTLLPEDPGFEKVEAMLNAAMSGEDYVDPDRDDNSGSAFAQQVAKTAAKAQAQARRDDEDDDEVPARASEPVVKETKVEKPVVETVDATPAPAASSSDDGDEQLDDIFAKIRQRRRQKATESDAE